MNGFKWLSLMLAWLWTGTGALCSAPGQTSAPSDQAPRDAGEYAIKATYLRNFVSFTYWPDTALGEPDKAILIGVFNPAPFGASFTALQGKTALRHPIKIRVCQTAEDAQDCHVVFVNPRESERTAALLDALRNKPVITAGEAPDFLAQGGIIRFLVADGRVHLEISLSAARQAGLAFSSQLLGIAKVVDHDKAP
jgi:hypothetical protein